MRERGEAAPMLEGTVAQRSPHAVVPNAMPEGAIGESTPYAVDEVSPLPDYITSPARRRVCRESPPGARRQ